MSADENWRSTNFRQSVVAKIDEAIQRSGMPTSKNSMEMENHVFQKAKTKEEYLAFVARLILHVREMSKESKNAGAMSGGGVPGQMIPDPINALQTLARQGTGNNQMMGLNAGEMPGGPVGMVRQPPPQNAATSLLQTLNQRPPGQMMNIPGMANKMGGLGMGPNQQGGPMGQMPGQGLNPQMHPQMGAGQMNPQMGQMNMPMGSQLHSQLNLMQQRKVQLLPLSEKEVNRISVDWVSGTCQPFAVFNNGDTKRFLNALRPDLKFPGPETVKKHIADRFTKYKLKVKEELAKSNSKVSCSVNGWMSRAGKGFYGITASYIDNEWQYRTIVLDFVPYNGRHTGKNIAKAFRDCMAELQLEGKLFGVVVDNATSHTSFGFFMPTFDAAANTNMPIKCFAHILDLGAQALLHSLSMTRPSENESDEESLGGQGEESEDNEEEDHEDAGNNAGADNVRVVEDHKIKSRINGSSTRIEGKAAYVPIVKELKIKPEIGESSSSNCGIKREIDDSSTPMEFIMIKKEEGTESEAAYVPIVKEPEIKPEIRKSSSSKCGYEREIDDSSSPMQKLLSIISKVKGDEDIKKQFISVCVTAKVPASLSLTLDCPTRWNSTYKILETAITSRAGIDTLCRTNPELSEFTINEDEWRIFSCVVKFLKNFDLLSRKLTREKFVSLSTSVVSFNLLLDKIAEIVDKLGKKTEKDDVDEKLLSAYISARDGMLLSYHRTHWLYCVALVLDPRHKLETFSATEWGRSIKEHTAVKFKQVFSQYDKRKIEEPAANQLAVDLDEDEIDFDQLFCWPDKSAQNWNNEVEEYFKDPRCPANENILSYWKVHQNRFPTIAAMARDIFSVNANSAATAERLFSKASLTTRKRKKRHFNEPHRHTLCLNSWTVEFPNLE